MYRRGEYRYKRREAWWEASRSSEMAGLTSKRVGHTPYRWTSYSISGCTLHRRVPAWVPIQPTCKGIVMAGSAGAAMSMGGWLRVAASRPLGVASHCQGSPPLGFSRSIVPSTSDARHTLDSFYRIKIRQSWAQDGLPELLSKRWSCWLVRRGCDAPWPPGQ